MIEEKYLGSRSRLRKFTNRQTINFHSPGTTVGQKPVLITDWRELSVCNMRQLVGLLGQYPRQLSFPKEKQEQMSQDLRAVLKWIGEQRIAEGNGSERQIQQGKIRKTKDIRQNPNRSICRPNRRSKAYKSNKKKSLPSGVAKLL